MKRYLIAAALILCAPQPILAQAEGFYVVLDNTTKQCRVMPGSELPSTQKARYKELGKYATMDEASSFGLHDRKCLPKIMIARTADSQETFKQERTQWLE